MPVMFVLTPDSSKPFRRTYYVRMLITFPRFLISTLEFRRELGLRYLAPEDRKFNRVISDISVELRKTTFIVWLSSKVFDS